VIRQEKRIDGSKLIAYWEAGYGVLIWWLQRMRRLASRNNEEIGDRKCKIDQLECTEKRKYKQTY
jgi:cytidylate kinase